MAEARQVGRIWEKSQAYHVIYWNIPRFFSLPIYDGFSVYSPSFTFSNATWCLKAYPNKYKERGTYGSLVLSIYRLHSDYVEQSFECISGLRYDSYRNACVRLMYSEYDEEYTELFRIERSPQFLDSTNELDYEGNEGVTFFCEMSIHKWVANASSQTELFGTAVSNVLAASKSIHTLRQNYKDVLLSGENHDVTLKVMGREFRAHQDVLRARSNVFKSMLNHNMMEKNSGVVSIPDCDPSAFEQFLLYVYSGRVEKLDQSNMLALYYVADKYDMADLKEGCRHFIGKSLCSRVICDVIELASKHGDSGLLGCATKYFADNMKDILQTVEWQMFLKNNSTKANEVLIQVAGTLADKTVVSQQHKKRKYSK